VTQLFARPPALVSIYLLISGFISVIVAIAVALISLGWFFRDGDDSARSLQEFVDDGSDFAFLYTKFGLWLLFAAGAGCLCFFALFELGRWLHPLL
jgi:hypothetical protein